MTVIKKIVVASDSFKGSLSSGQVADSVEKGVKAVFPDCRVVKVEIADGGEGTVDALVSTLKGRYIEAIVNDPLMRPVRTRYGILDDGATAVIEMAAASGLTLLAQQQRNPMITTTYGTGELILDAIGRGCRNFLVGIGGSATNDGGTGMLQALGYRLLDSRANELGRGGQILSQIEAIDDSERVKELDGCRFTVACDVTNPFYGPDGAAYVFAPQKGADKEAVAELDRGLKHFAAVIKRFNGADIGSYPGAGAAGGLGGCFKALLGGQLVPGIKMVLDAVGFDGLIRDADMVITGEGRLDRQTAMGKAPAGVLAAASAQDIPVIAIGGAVEDPEELNRSGFTAVFPIQPGAVSLEEAMDPVNASANISRTVEQIMRAIRQTKTGVI